MKKIHIIFLNLFGVFAVCSLLFSFSISSVKAQDALEKAIDYAVNGGSLNPKLEDKYNVAAQKASLKCADDDNNTNLNIDPLVANPLDIAKPSAAGLGVNSDINDVMAEIGAAVVPKTGLVPTGNCGPR